MDDDEEMNDEEFRNEMGIRDDNDNESEGDRSESESERESESNGPAVSQYEKDKAKNIAQLKDILVELDKTHPMPKIPKPERKMSKSKKKEKGKEVERRTSTRLNKVERCVRCYRHTRIDG